MYVHVHAQSLSCVQFLASLWTTAYQAPLSMGFSRQEYWSGLSFPSPGDLPNPGIFQKYCIISLHSWMQFVNILFRIFETLFTVRLACNFSSLLIHIGMWILLPLSHLGGPDMYVLLPSHFSRVRLCATPQTATHQALPSLGFSRQEHWSGLPFPPPTHESEKGKWSHSGRVWLLATPWTAA